MLEADDPVTQCSIRQLWDLAESNSKPFVFWIGAGASHWCGYPLWNALTNTIHRHFAGRDPRYSTAAASEALAREQFPSVIEFAAQANQGRLRTLLADTFAPKSPTPLYTRLITALNSMSPLHIVTTNIDELLEKNLPTVETIQRNAIERASDSLRRGRGFILKLHGTISDPESLVLTASDYANFSDSQYRSKLSVLFSAACVVFIGYGFRDGHVIQALVQASGLNSIFGDGPHFWFTPERAEKPFDGILPIRYSPAAASDHRCVLNIIEELSYHLGQRKSASPVETKPRPSDSSLRSSHLLSLLVPPGTWTTSQAVTIIGSENEQRELICGIGITDEEMPCNRSTAMHDLLVGLCCFDQLYAPLSSMGIVHSMVGSETFWRLIGDDIIRFITWELVVCEGMISPFRTPSR